MIYFTFLYFINFRIFNNVVKFNAKVMLVKVYGSAVFGVEASKITVEVNICKGRKYFMVGLPDNAVKESWSRVESALRVRFTCLGWTSPSLFG